MAKKVAPTPTADAGGPYTAQVDIPVELDGSGSSTPTGTLVSYKWDFGDNTKSVVSNSPTTFHTYKKAGSYAVTLTVENSLGKTKKDTSKVSVLAIPQPDRPPRAVLTISGDLIVGQSVSASTYGTLDPDGNSVTLSLDWGDGSSPATSTVANSIFSHIYTTAGTYTISLTVTDQFNESNTAAVVVQIAVAPSPQPPTAQLTLLTESTTDPTIFNVSTSAQLTAALVQAAAGTIPAGSTILLAPGTYVGNFILPVHPPAPTPPDGSTPNQYITIKSSGSIPADGVRVSPSDASQLAILQSDVGGTSPLRTAAGAHDWKLIGLGFTQTAGNTFGLLWLGAGDSTQTSTSQCPYNIEVDRCYFYVGDGIEERRGIALNSASTTIKNCYIVNIKDVNGDSQAIGGWNGPGPYVIDNNYLEAQSENILFGGSDPAISGLVPSNISITNNTITKRLAWEGVRPVKNLLELKNAKNVRIAYNTFSNCWVSGQDGWSMVFTVANQNGTAPQTTIQNVLVEYNTITSVAGGWDISGKDPFSAHVPMDGVTIRHNVLKTDAVAMGGGGAAFLVLNSPDNLVIDNNTLLNEGTFMQMSDKDGSELAPGFKCRNNLAYYGTYGLISDGHIGTDGLDYYFDTDYVFTGNVLATDGTPDTFPATNTFPSTSAFQAEFVDYAGGDFNLIEDSTFEGKGATILAAPISTTQNVKVSTAGTVGYPLATGTLTWGDGFSVSWTGNPASTYEHIYTDAGTYTITLTVIDAQSRSASAQVVVEISASLPPPNISPIVSITAQGSIFINQSASFTVVATDSDGTIDNGSIDWGDGSSATTFTGSPDFSYSHTYTVAGNYTVTLTAEDDDGAVSTATVDITAQTVIVPPPNNPPSVSLTFVSGQYVNQTITLSASASDSDGTVTSWSLNWGNGTTSGSGTPPSIHTRTYSTAGTYTPSLTVTDDDGASTTALVTIQVQNQPVVNQPPLAFLSLTSGTFAGDTFIFSVSASDTDGTLVSGSLNWGDGSATQTWTGTPPSAPAHIFSTAATRTVTLTVTDNQGASTTTTLSVVVAAVGSVTSPLGLNVHPRLFITSSDISTHATRVSTGGEWNSDFQTYVNTVQAYWNVDPLGIGITRLPRLAMGAAYIYQLFDNITGITWGGSSNTKAAWGAKAVTWLMATITVDPNLSQTYWPPTRCAIVATDWLWSLLTAGQKSSLLTWYKQVDTDAWIASTMADPNAGALANWHNNQFLQAWTLKIMVGLVFSGAGIDDTWATNSYSAYNQVARGTNGWNTKDTTRGGTDGSWSQGMGYGQSYDQFPMIACENAWRTANGLSRSTHYTPSAAGNIRGIPVLSGYRIRPRTLNGGSVVLGLKDFHANWDSYGYDDYSQCASIALAAYELDGVDQDRADFARWLRTNKYNESSDPEWWIWTRFLGPKGTEKTGAQANMALNRQFATGEWHMMSGLLSSTNDTHVMVLGHKFATDTGSPGHFSIDYMGPVIVVPSAGGHDPDAVAAYGFANMMGAPELNRTTYESTIEPFIVSEDMGFKRWYQRGDDFNSLQSNSLADFHDLSLARFHTPIGSEKATYLYLDQKRTYNTDTVNDNAFTGQSVKWVDPTRQFVVIQPATPGTDSLKVFIFDQGSVKVHSPEFHRRLCFYLPGDPTINGSESTGPSRGDAGTTGKKTYTGASLVTLTQNTMGMDNKLWMRVYSPTAYNIVEVNYRRNNQVEDAYGIMRDCSSQGSDSTLAPYCGTYRVEFIPTTQNTSENMLTAMEITPSAGSESTRANITGTNFYGAQIGTDIVVFATTAGSTSGTIVLPDVSATYRVVMLNVARSSARTLAKGANIGTITNLANADTDLSFTTSAEGTLEITAVVTSGGDAASRTITFS